MLLRLAARVGRGWHKRLARCAGELQWKSRELPPRWCRLPAGGGPVKSIAAGRLTWEASRPAGGSREGLGAEWGQRRLPRAPSDADPLPRWAVALQAQAGTILKSSRLTISHSACLCSRRRRQRPAAHLADNLGDSQPGAGWLGRLVARSAALIALLQKGGGSLSAAWERLAEPGPPPCAPTAHLRPAVTASYLFIY